MGLEVFILNTDARLHNEESAEVDFVTKKIKKHHYLKNDVEYAPAWIHAPLSQMTTVTYKPQPHTHTQLLLFSWSPFLKLLQDWPGCPNKNLWA